MKTHSNHAIVALTWIQSWSNTSHTNWRNQMAGTMKDLILKNLSNNGYPAKAVSLPLEKLYEAADNKGENLNSILEELASEGTLHTKTGDKIIFRSSPMNSAEGFGMSPEMMKKAQEMMNGMDPAELQRIQEQVSQMSPEERENLMNKAKSMGLF